MHNPRIENNFCITFVGFSTASGPAPKQLIPEVVKIRCKPDRPNRKTGRCALAACSGSERNRSSSCAQTIPELTKLSFDKPEKNFRLLGIRLSILVIEFRGLFQFKGQRQNLNFQRVQNLP